MKTIVNIFRKNISYEVLCGLSFLQLAYIVAVFLISIVLVGKYYSAADFLVQIEVIPLPGHILVIGLLILFPVLLILMQLHKQAEPTSLMTFLYLLLEIVVCFFLLRLTSFSSNEILLLVAANILTLSISRTIKGAAMVLLAITFVSTRYDVISNWIEVTSFESYLYLYDASAVTFLQGLRSVFSTMMILMFIIYSLFLLQDQVKKQLKIRQENKELEELNETLRVMADMREKMGETKERNRLAREIHDTLGHTLTGLSTGIDAVGQLLKTNPQLAEKQLQLLSHTAKEGLQDVRRSVNRLRPDALESHTLKEALNTMMESFKASTGVKIHYVCHLSSLDFHQDEEEAIYRIVQESMTNSVRHGHATEIYITFARDEDTLIIIVEDNGTGCAEIKEGFGLHHMKERVQLLSGDVHFYSNHGFEVIVEIPLRKEENEK